MVFGSWFEIQGGLQLGEQGCQKYEDQHEDHIENGQGHQTSGIQ